MCFQLTTHWTEAWGSRSVQCDIRHSWHSCWIMEVYAPLKWEKMKSHTDEFSHSPIGLTLIQALSLSQKKNKKTLPRYLCVFNQPKFVETNVCFEPSNSFIELQVDECSPSSIQVIPRDQMSTFPSYWPSSMARMTSGAILSSDGWKQKTHSS